MPVRMKKCLYIPFVLFVACSAVSGMSTVDSILVRLDDIIADRQYFTEIKQQKILEIKQAYLEDKNGPNPREELDFLAALSREYQTFRFDSAFHYSSLFIEKAYASGSPADIARAKTDFANILISAGNFHEAIDTLQSVSIDAVSPLLKAEYYQVLSRGYFDMESFSQSNRFSSIYRQKGADGFDSALHYYPEESWDYQSLDAQKKIKRGENEEAIAIIRDLIHNYHLSNDELAVQYMQLSFVHGIIGEDDEALRYMVEASIADVRGAKKEAVALLFVANYLFERGEIMKASKYINRALEDIQFYGSNFRLWQVSQFLPVIKSEHIVTIENQKRKMWFYMASLAILALAVLASLAIIFKQLKRNRKANRIIEKTNKQLSMINEELILANRIKEEYVGYYFSVSTQMIEKLEKFKNSVDRKLRRKMYDEIGYDLEQINIHREKLYLYNKFDQIFLEIFPDFIRKFNSLLADGKEIRPKKDHLMNTELRIYALIRLGISDNEMISRILDYSVNTIYTYKTKVKKMARPGVEDFEREVMKIKRYRTFEDEEQHDSTV